MGKAGEHGEHNTAEYNLAEHKGSLEYYKKETDQVLKILNSSKNGLTAHEANKRLEKHGLNELVRSKKLTKTKIFIDQFKDVMILMLFVAAGISFAIGHRVDSIIILFVVTFNSIFGFIQEYRAEKSIEALKMLTSLKSTVFRDGEKIEIDSKDAVPGDILYLESGNKVPADARIIESSNLESNESALTGESVPVKKDPARIESACPLSEQHNMIFSGNIITKGHCLAIVTATSMDTEIGRIARRIQEVKEEKTPLQVKLTRLSKWIGLFVMVITAFVFLLNIRTSDYVSSFIFGISLAVAAIPEGLPAVVTITFAIGVRRMIKKKALMRKLSSIETLGSVDVICTDKTGTLTKNEMTVKKLYHNGKIIDVSGDGYFIEGDFLICEKKIDGKKLSLLLSCGALCNDSSLAKGDAHGSGSNGSNAANAINTHAENWRVIGDPTEGALLVSARKSGLDYRILQDKQPRIDEIPFNSVNKYMITVHSKDKKRTIYAKGATEQILELCTSIELDGKKKKLTKEEKEKILLQNDLFAKSAMRVLAFAYKDNIAAGKGKEKAQYEKDLTFLGLQAMRDPPREEVKGAIATAHSAGITVIMITGDHKTTAEAIAAEIGIEGKSMSGDELSSLAAEELRKAVEQTRIFARVNPEDKLRIVEALQKNGHIVAMTGDGINDAPALKKANVGIAVGSGTDVAKEAAHMIITDDDFKDIVAAIEEGRRIYDNIRKFLSFMLSTHLAEIFIITGSLLLGLPLPFTAIQLLWLNIVTDGFPALALSMDPKEEGIMNRKPRRADESILPKNILIIIMVLSFFITAGAFFLINLGLQISIEKMQSLVFTAIVILEIVTLFAIRAEYNVKFFSNKYLFMAVATSIFLQLFVIYGPLAGVFRSVRLTFADWAAIAFIGASLVLVAYALKKLMHLFSDDKPINQAIAE